MQSPSPPVVGTTISNVEVSSHLESEIVLPSSVLAGKFNLLHPSHFTFHDEANTHRPVPSIPCGQVSSFPTAV